MKIGDLVKMKRMMFWQLKETRYRHYTEQPLLVMEQAHNAVKVLYPDGSVKADLADHYDVVSEGVELTDEDLEGVVGGRSPEQFEEWRIKEINKRPDLFTSKKDM